MAKDSKPHLVPLDEKPVSIRRSVYSDLVQEFANDPTMKYARVEDAKPSAVVSIKKAIAKYNLSEVIVAYTSNGMVILEKTTAPSLPPHIVLKKSLSKSK